jgi:CRP/FNR family cyclic AMP-dependent transcriptional regulator
MEPLGKIIKEHPFFENLIPEYIELIAGCASLVKFDENHMILKEGETADNFYLIRNGKIALQMQVPNQETVILDTIREGEVVGWSWLFSPYQTHFDARALESTRAISFDGKCLRKKIDQDHNLGFHIMTQFVKIIQDRLQATRLKLIEMYGVGK